MRLTWLVSTTINSTVKAAAAAVVVEANQQHFTTLSAGRCFYAHPVWDSRLSFRLTKYARRATSHMQVRDRVRIHGHPFFYLFLHVDLSNGLTTGTSHFESRCSFAPPTPLRQVACAEWRKTLRWMLGVPNWDTGPIHEQVTGFSAC